MSLSADTCVESRRYSVAHVFPMAGAMVGPFLNSNTFVGTYSNYGLSQYGLRRPLLEHVWPANGVTLAFDTYPVCVLYQFTDIRLICPALPCITSPHDISINVIYVLSSAGKLENFSADWDTATGVHLGRGAPGGGARAGLPFDKRVGYHMTSDHPFANAIRRSFRRLLAADSSFAKALCALLYVDFACFDYPLWPACKDIREDMEHMLFS